MIDFGVNMKSALDDFNNGIDMKNITAFGKVFSSEKITEALEIAKEMDELALKCVDKSVKMIDSIDAGMKTLPDFFAKKLDKRMENAREKGSRDGDPELPDIDKDCQELEKAVESIKNVNPLSALESFQSAFDGIINKGGLCKEMFETMRAFAEDVAGVSDAIHNFKLGKFIGKMQSLVKDIWRCLRLSDLIRSFAKAAERVIGWIVNLVQALVEKINSIDIDYSSWNCFGTNKQHSSRTSSGNNSGSEDESDLGCGCLGDMESLFKQSGLSMTDLQTYGEKFLKTSTTAK